MVNTEMSILHTPIFWPPRPGPIGWYGAVGLYTKDQCKANVLWLVHPAVDAVWNCTWRGDEAAKWVCDNFAHDIRLASHLPPIEFVKWWKGSGYDWSGTFGADYEKIMSRRAGEAQARLFPGSVGQVIYVEFGKSGQQQ